MVLAPETRARWKRAAFSALRSAAVGGLLGALCATAIPEHLPFWRALCRLAVTLLRGLP